MHSWSEQDKWQCRSRGLLDSLALKRLECLVMCACETPSQLSCRSVAPDLKTKMELSSSIQFIFRELQTRNGRVRLSKGTSFTEKRWCHFNLSDHKWEDLFSRQSSKSKMILHVGFFSFLWHTCVACQCIQETLVSSAFHELPPDFFFFIIFAINNEVTLPLCRHEKNLDTYTFVKETERKERSQENKAHSCM